MAKQNNGFQFGDLTVICCIVTSDPEIKTSKNGRQYAYFTAGVRYGNGEKKKYKNYSIAAYNEVGNEILALVKKNNNILLRGHVGPYLSKNVDGTPKAILWMNVLSWSKDPTRKEWNAEKKELTIVPAQDDFTEGYGNEEILF